MKEFRITKNLTYFSIVFQIFGICPALPDTKIIISKIIQFLIILNTAILLTITFIIYNYEELIFHSRDIIGKFTDVLELVAPIMAHMVAIFESVWARKDQNKIWNKITEFNLTMKDFKLICYKKEERRFSIKFFLLNISILSEIAIIAIASSEGEYKWSRHWYCRIYSNIVGRLGNLQLIMYIEFLCSRIRNINKELIHISNLTELYFIEKIHLRIYRSIEKIKLSHSIFWDISETMNSRFGWSLLFSITNYFICLTVDFYWIFVHFNETGEHCVIKIVCSHFRFRNYSIDGTTKTFLVLDIKMYTASVLCVVGPASSVYFIFSSYHSLIQESNLCPKLLHKIRRKQSDRKINKLVI